ncbi:MAG: hypothetical protein AAF490_25995 [Chloroflexota bacterium]
MTNAENMFPIDKLYCILTFLLLFTSCSARTNRARILDEIIDLNPEMGEIQYYGQPWETLDFDQAKMVIEMLPILGEIRTDEDETKIRWEHRTFNTDEILFFDDSGIPILLRVDFHDSRANPHFSQITEKLRKPDQVGAYSYSLFSGVEVVYKFPNHIAIFGFKATGIEGSGCETTNLYLLDSYQLIRADSFEELNEDDAPGIILSEVWFADFEIDGDEVTVCSEVS